MIKAMRKANYNTFRNASLFFSLRDVFGVGDLIEVVRQSNNDFDRFTTNQITNGDLVSFCNGSQGLVSWWKEQTGNSFDVSQTNNSQRPEIVDVNGNLITENGKPAIRFNGNQYLTAGLGNSLNYTDKLELYRVINSDNLAAGRIMSDDKIGAQGYFIDYFLRSSSFFINNGGGYYNITNNLLQINMQALYTTIFNNGSIEHFFNTQSQTRSISGWSGNIQSSGQAGFTIGSNANGGQNFEGTIQEIAINNQINNNSQIRQNINNYYNIY